jgi:hypothetical protein
MCTLRDNDAYRSHLPTSLTVANTHTPNAPRPFPYGKYGIANFLLPTLQTSVPLSRLPTFLNARQPGKTSGFNPDSTSKLRLAHPPCRCQPITSQGPKDWCRMGKNRFFTGLLWLWDEAFSNLRWSSAHIYYKAGGPSLVCCPRLIMKYIVVSDKWW